MGVVLSYILLVLVAALAIFAVYLLIRILRIFYRARKLDMMRNYETILYAALRKLGPERTLDTLLPNPDPKILEEVLLRMGDEGAEGWKDRVIELYRLSGFTEKRLNQLHSRLKSRRATAARRLGRIADPEALPQLEDLLQDEKEEVREAALYALGRIGTREALEVMLDALDLGDRWTQEKVAETVEEAGDESRYLLVELLRDRSPVRRTFAAEVLGRVGGLEEVAYLKEALMDEEVDVRARAADSLGKMRQPASRDALLKALKDPDWQVRSQVVKALGKIGDEDDTPRLVAALRDPEWWVRNNAAFALREMGEVGEVPLMEALWDEDRFARETAAQALEESSMVERIVEDMRGQKDDPKGERIIHRLAEIGCTGTISQVLVDQPDQAVKDRLVSLLGDIQDPGLRKVLAETSGNKAEKGIPAPEKKEYER
jgi:HEAT repeat protein